MIICGLKLTHDGAIALVDNGKLIFCHEMEKIDNSRRYSEFKLDFSHICRILEDYGYHIDNVDKFVIDGWGDELGFSEKKDFEIEVDLGNGKFNLKFAEYGHLITNEDVLERFEFNYQDQGLSYSSYRHISGHLMASYCTSPFATAGEDSFILTWDGGMPPQLSYFHYESGRVENIGILFPLMGFAYPHFAIKFKPYDHLGVYDMSIAGKVMAYIALGKVREDLLNDFNQIFKAQNAEIQGLELTPVIIRSLTHILLEKFVEHGKTNSIESVDMIATFHQFINNLLVSSLRDRLSQYPEYKKNLCNSGGCALSIKWNSSIRECGAIEKMWIPPFPNDSGSAIGAACCEMVNLTRNKTLQWNVYSGPGLIDRAPLESWTSRPCSLEELAKLLYETSEPVICLKGNAELGPRALGNRSILAPAISPSMKDHLNKIKEREYYRPVAPICIEEDAPTVFSPGSPDPLMLFDHKVKPGWENKVPAICHLDGTSRIQTVNQNQNPEIYQILQAYKKLSGIPLLCNTSANYKGKGFFPDLRSAMEWGKTRYVWSNGILYSQL